MRGLTNVDFKQFLFALGAVIRDILKIGVIVVSIGISILLATGVVLGIFVMFFGLYCVGLCRKYTAMTKHLRREVDTSNTTKIRGIVIHPKQDTEDDRND